MAPAIGATSEPHPSSSAASSSTPNLTPATSPRSPPPPVASSTGTRSAPASSLSGPLRPLPRRSSTSCASTAFSTPSTPPTARAPGASTSATRLASGPRYRVSSRTCKVAEWDVPTGHPGVLTRHGGEQWNPAGGNERGILVCDRAEVAIRSASASLLDGARDDSDAPLVTAIGRHVQELMRDDAESCLPEE